MKTYDKIKFDKPTKFLGRNGMFDCTGLEIFLVEDVIYISPITSKGETGRAEIQIPKENVLDVINIINIMEGML